MKQRRVTLTDGRYLIFFTFEDETAPSLRTINGDTQNESVDKAHERKPEPSNEAAEERRV